jgi:two-component system chemotaxis sensor kinase CheA
MSGLDELRISFFQECEDLLESLGEGLRAMAELAAEGSADGDIETVHAVFRAVHSIKGGAGAFGLDDLVTFAHLFETVLDEMRGGKMEIAEDVMHVLLRAGDMLSDLVACARDGVSPDADRMGQLLAELDALAEGGATADDDAAFEFVPTIVDVAPIVLPEIAGDTALDLSGGAPTETTYTIRFAPKGELYGTGNEPQALFRALRQLGTLAVDGDPDAVAPLSRFDPAEPRLRWHLTLATGAGREEVESIFEFVADVADISIEALADPGPGRDLAADPAALPEVGAEGDPSGAPGTTATAHTAPADEPPARLPPSEETPSDVSVPAPATPDATQPADTAPTPNSAPPTAVSAAAPATIRVNLDRVDRLINLIGELVIMEAMLSQAVESAGIASDSDVSNGLDGIKQLASGIQESVMAIRAQPLKPVFQRMHRIIREAADATGKQVRLVTIGDATEVDKTVIERLVDPLTHMIRNSVDHGLEDTAERGSAAANRKPARSRCRPRIARGASSSKCPMTAAGSTARRCARSPRKKGLVAPGASLSAGEIDNLLFTPGFSSKEEVSALSGRGVGLDVVRREIQALGGRVTIQSAAGGGYDLHHRPAPHTRRSRRHAGRIRRRDDGASAVRDPRDAAPVQRDDPFDRANRAASWPTGASSSRSSISPRPSASPSPADEGDRDVLLLVECEAGRRAALAVDVIHDQRQVVIKSLEENYGVDPRHIRGDHSRRRAHRPDRRPRGNHRLRRASTPDPLQLAANE